MTVGATPVAILPAMPKHLVIVESPAKARTIERYLGDDYRVLASYGHVRDLPENPGKGKFGVDVDNGFTPEYVIADDRRKQVDAIQRAAKASDLVWLATDLDREGEAIAWHVAEAAGVPASKTRRVTFSEITESAIREAFEHRRQHPARRAPVGPEIHQYRCARRGGQHVLGKIRFVDINAVRAGGHGRCSGICGCAS